MPHAPRVFRGHGAGARDRDTGGGCVGDGMKIYKCEHNGKTHLADMLTINTLIAVYYLWRDGVKYEEVVYDGGQDVVRAWLDGRVEEATE